MEHGPKPARSALLSKGKPMAMVLRRPRSFGRGTTQRGNVLRPVAWIRRQEFDLPIVPATPVGFVLVDDAQFEEFTRPTVVRIRLREIMRVVDITLGAQAVITQGITIVNPTEPSPDAFVERDGGRWLWWHTTRLENPPGSVVVNFLDRVSWQELDVDIKSMRKRTMEGSTLQLVTVMTAGLAEVSIDYGSSVLVKE